MFHAEDGYTSCHNEYVSGGALKGDIASSKPSILCDPLVKATSLKTFTGSPRSCKLDFTSTALLLIVLL